MLYENEIERERVMVEVLLKFGFDNRKNNIRKLTTWSRFEKGSTFTLNLKTGLYYLETDDRHYVDDYYMKSRDFPIIYGVDASHAFFLTDNSNIKFGLSYEYFKEIDHEYNNNKIEFRAGYNADINPLFNISLNNSIEHYSYEVFNFPDNANADDIDLKVTNSFTFLKFTGIIRFFPNESWLIYGSINSTSLHYDGPDSTVLSFELGTHYNLDFKK
jgi:hypothetical protein